MVSLAPILITGYVNPDLDGVAGMVAYAELLNQHGRPAQVGILGEPHDEAKYVLARFKLTTPPSVANADDFSQVILVDASDLIGLEGRVAPEKVIEIIDHRSVNEADKFPQAQKQIELVGAAATLVAEKFIQQGLSMSAESAILVYSAIISNTLNFKGGVTTERDRAAARWLEQFITVPANYWRELFLAKSDLSRSKLAERIEGDFAWLIIGDKRVGIAQLEIIGAAELIANREAEMIMALTKLKTDLQLDYIFQNTIELEQQQNYIVASDQSTRQLLEKVLDVSFQGNLAIRDQLIMRKQIIPLIKAELTK
jgi:manganese-dependent inorganic pyrophosphatase